MATFEDGMAELIANIEKLKKAPSKKSLLAGSYVLQKYSQENAPCDTGYLRSSAESVETEEGVSMNFTANYAYYQEVGVPSRNIPANGYVRRALDEHSKDILDAIEKRTQEDL